MLRILVLLASIAILGGCQPRAVAVPGDETRAPDELFAVAATLHSRGFRDQAVAYYEQAAAAGDPRAMLIVVNLGLTSILSQDLGRIASSEPVPSGQSYAAALDAMNRRGADGDDEALVLAGIMHFVGRGTARDTVRARVLVERAAENGSAQAHYWLGWMHEREERYDRAAIRFEQALALGYYAALADLAMLHVEGRLDSDDYARGMAMLRVAHAKGDMRAGELFLGLLERTELNAADGNELARRRLEELRMTGLREVRQLATD